MNTITTYQNRFKNIASRLGYSGQAVEVLVQMLAQAVYIEEVENIIYMQEASLEKANLENSKIQKCVDQMYSVYRGLCPRVVMKLKPTKYLELNPYDKIIDSQNFTVHYLGYYKASLNSAATATTNTEIIDGSEGSGSTSSSTTTTSDSTSTTDEFTFHYGDDEEINSSSDPITVGESETSWSSPYLDSTSLGGTITAVDYTLSNTYVASSVVGVETDGVWSQEFTWSECGYLKVTATVTYTTNSGDSSTATSSYILYREPTDTSTSPDHTIEDTDNYTGEWIYSSYTMYPAETNSDIIIIKALIAPKRSGENLTIKKTINSTNTFYVDCTTSDLSNDMWVKINDSSEFAPTTRVFSDHILEGKIFDLTLPSYASRLYVANYFQEDDTERDSGEIEGITTSTTIQAQYYGFSELSSYNTNELKRLQFKGTELVEFEDYTDESGNLLPNLFLVQEGIGEYEEVGGLCYIAEVPKDTINTIHYKANRDRYSTSILRSNSDLGIILEDTFPDIVVSGGTNALFTSSTSSIPNVTIYYIPKDYNITIKDSEIEEFLSDKLAYYIVESTVSVTTGDLIQANFTIDLEIYNNSSDYSFSDDITQNILEDNYEKKFNIVFDSDTLEEIKALISKLDYVKKVSSIEVSYSDSSGSLAQEDIDEFDEGTYYFTIEATISAKVTETT